MLSPIDERRLIHSLRMEKHCGSEKKSCKNVFELMSTFKL